MKLEINTFVYHMDIYDGKQEMKIVGIREHQVELEGDFTGGTHHTIGKSWFPIEGLLFEGKESSTKLTKEDVAESKNLLYESDDIMLEACLIIKEDGSLAYDFISITLIDKTPNKRKDWKEHFLDNPTWFFGVLDGDGEAITEALTIINKEQFLQLKDFITYLYNNEWLKKPIEDSKNEPNYPMFLKRSDGQLFMLDKNTYRYKSYPYLDNSAPLLHYTCDNLTHNYGFKPCDKNGKYIDDDRFPLSTEVRDKY